MNVSSTISKILAGALALTLCGTPELAAAQQTTTQPQQQTAPAQQNQQQPATTGQQAAPAQNQQSPTNGVKVDPAAGPQEPTPGEAKPPVETSPNAANEPATTDQQQQQTAPDAPSAVQQRSQQPTIKENPVGTAVAEKANTRGGAASKPAGAAIAPAKQKQTRGLFLKYGAVIAAGAALGTVYALTRGTSSVPPGAAH